MKFGTDSHDHQRLNYRAIRSNGMKVKSYLRSHKDALNHDLSLNLTKYFFPRLNRFSVNPVLKCQTCLKQ